MTRDFGALDLATQQQIIRAVPARAGEEMVIERTKDGHIGRIWVDINEQPVCVTIVVVGEWDDWYPEKVCFS